MSDLSKVKSLPMAVLGLACSFACILLPRIGFPEKNYQHMDFGILFK
jgi:hypothetical protein